LKTWPQMLASTVQFSNNDQPPITPSRNSSALGPALKEVHSLRHPTACPTPSLSGPHVPRRRSTSDPSSRVCRVVNVPPMSNQHRTCADVLASDLVPKDSVRSAP